MPKCVIKRDILGAINMTPPDSISEVVANIEPEATKI